MFRRWTLKRLENAADEAEQRDRLARDIKSLSNTVARYSASMQALNKDGRLDELQRIKVGDDIWLFEHKFEELRKGWYKRLPWHQRMLRSLRSWTRKGASQRAQEAPGMSLSRFLNRLYGERYSTRVFDPILADMQRDLQEAKERGDHGLFVAAIYVRSYWGLAKASGLLWVFKMFYRIYSAFKANS